MSFTSPTILLDANSPTVHTNTIEFAHLFQRRRVHRWRPIVYKVLSAKLKNFHKTHVTAWRGLWCFNSQSVSTFSTVTAFSGWKKHRHLPSGNATIWKRISVDGPISSLNVVAVIRFLCLYLTYPRGSLNHNLEHPDAFHRLSVETPIAERRSSLCEGAKIHINNLQVITKARWRDNVNARKKEKKAVWRGSLFLSFLFFCVFYVRGRVSQLSKVERMNL